MSSACLQIFVFIDVNGAYLFHGKGLDSPKTNNGGQNAEDSFVEDSVTRKEETPENAEDDVSSPAGAVTATESYKPVELSGETKNEGEDMNESSQSTVETQNIEDKSLVTSLKTNSEILEQEKSQEINERSDEIGTHKEMDKKLATSFETLTVAERSQEMADLQEEKDKKIEIVIVDEEETSQEGLCHEGEEVFSRCNAKAKESGEDPDKIAVVGGHNKDEGFSGAIVETDNVANSCGKVNHNFTAETNKFRTSEEESKIRTNEKDKEELFEAGLSEAGLPKAGLSEAGLSEAGLSETGLSETGLCEAGLIQTGLSETGLSEAGLIETGLSEARLPEAGLLEAGLSETRLSEARLPKAGLPKAGLSETGLPEAGLSETGLCEAGLPEAQLSQAQLSEAQLPEAGLSKRNAEEEDGDIPFKAEEETKNDSDDETQNYESYVSLICCADFFSCLSKVLKT